MIGVTPAANEVFIDRSRSGPRFHDKFTGRHAAPVDLRSGKVSLRVLVDQSIIELYINDGTATITDRFFPGADLKWSASARGGAATIRKLDAWTLAKPKDR